MAETTLNPSPTQDRTRFGAMGIGTIVSDIGVSMDESSPPGSLHFTRLNLNTVPLIIPNGASEFVGVKLFTFPIGRILMLSAMGSVAFTTTSPVATTIAAASSLLWGFGSAVATASTLTGTMSNYLPASGVSTGALNVASAVSLSSLASLGSPGFQDGLATAIAAYLNVSVATNTADGVMFATGYINMNWMFCGDT